MIIWVNHDLIAKLDYYVQIIVHFHRLKMMAVNTTPVYGDGYRAALVAYNQFLVPPRSSDATGVGKPINSFKYALTELMRYVHKNRQFPPPPRPAVLEASPLATNNSSGGMNGYNSRRHGR